MSRRRRVIVTIILGLAWVAVGPNDSTAQEPGRKVFALLVFDTDTGLAGLLENETNLQACLQTQLPDGAIVIRTLKGGDVNARTIGTTIDEIARQMNPRIDTFVFYYSGHGATVNGDHSLTLHSREIVPRRTIRRKLLAINPRLAVLLTDCCATSVVLKPDSAPTKTAPAPQAPGAIKPPVHVLEQLLLQHRGLVDINSSSFDEASWTSNDEGGMFTKSFARLVFQNDPTLFDRLPTDGFVTWDEFFTRLRGDTIQTYQFLRTSVLQSSINLEPELREAIKGQVDQRPFAFSLATRDRGVAVPELYAANLGIHYEIVPIFGVKLTSDAPPGSVGAQRRLEKGDMFVLIDNMPIYGPKDVRNHVARTTVRFVNVRTGLAEQAVFQLPGQIVPWTDDDIAPNFGVPIEPVSLLGARLTRDAPANSAASQRPLERGDMIVLLDGQPIQKPEDVLAHQARTPVVFVNIRSGQAEDFVFQLPNR